MKCGGCNEEATRFLPRRLLVVLRYESPDYPNWVCEGVAGIVAGDALEYITTLSF